MNFFELYDLPVQFSIDLSVLKKKYIEQSKQSHPDLHTLSSEANQLDMLEQSTLNNNAYQVLKDDQKRIKYILQLHEMIEEEEQYQMSPAFLGEMMDLNENVMDLQMDFDASKKTSIISSLQRLVDEQHSEAKRWMDAYDSGEKTKEHLEKIKAYYFKLKYLNRLKENIDQLEE